jgi:hypothetical protein
MRIGWAAAASGADRALLTGRCAACSAACTCCRSSTRSTAPTPASTRSTMHAGRPAPRDWPGRCALAGRRRDGRRDRQPPVSASPQFEDFVGKGPRLALRRAVPDAGARYSAGGATDAGLAAIYRPRPGLPLTPVTLANGERVLWTTFTPQQVDIDVFHPAGRRYLDAILAHLAGARRDDGPARRGRLRDQEAGHSCFMMPETFAFIADLSPARARARHGSAGRDPLALREAGGDRAPVSTGCTTSRCRRSCCTRFAFRTRSRSRVAAHPAGNA